MPFNPRQGAGALDAVSQAIQMYMGLRKEKQLQQRQDADIVRSTRQAQAEMLGRRPDLSPVGLEAVMADMDSLSSIRDGNAPPSAVGALFKSGRPIEGDTIQHPTNPGVPTEVTGQGRLAQMAMPQYKDIRDPAVVGNQSFQGTGMGPTGPLGASESVTEPLKLIERAKLLSDFHRTDGQPVAKDQMPIFRSAGEMATERGEMEAATYMGRIGGQRKAEEDALKRMGATDSDIRTAMLRKYGGAARSMVQPYVFMMPDGTRFSAQLDKTGGGGWTDLNGAPMQIPPGAVQIGLAAPNQDNFFTDDYGNISGQATNKYNPNITQAIPIQPTVQGRSSPDGPVGEVTGPEGQPVPGRFDRRGAGFTPALDPFGQQSTGGRGQTPRPPVRPPVAQPTAAPPPVAGQPKPPVQPANPNAGMQPAVEPRYATHYQAPQAATVEALNAAENGMKVLKILRDTWDPSFTGIIQGPMNSFNQQYNPLAEADPKFRVFQTNWASARNDLLKANAGLTQTEAEKQNTMQQIMRLNDKDENFIPALDSLNEYFNRKISAQRQNAGRSVPFDRNNPAAPQTAKPAPTIGQTITVGGRPATVTGINPQTGKPIVRFN